MSTTPTTPNIEPDGAARTTEHVAAANRPSHEQRPTGELHWDTTSWDISAWPAEKES
jgi:hypothetical protein